MIINTIASAEVYYLAPTGGNDSNPGTISQPWATWSKAIRMAYPGDTVYIRGGKYYHTSSSGVTIIPDDGIGRAGTKTQPISYIGYPPDVLSGNKPIIDCIGYPTDVSYMQGMRLRKNANYIILKDFDIINVIQSPTAPGFHNGLYIAGSNNVTVINVTVRNIGGAGFGVSGDSITFINCDAWYCTDPYTTTNPYGAGDGWQIASDWQRYTTWLIGCRAIHCSDDGYDNYWNDGYVFYDSCWALGNGYDSNFKIYGPTGAGNGFKLGPNLRLFATGTVQRSMENCISVDNRSIGYTENCLGKCTMLQNYYNNISYRNGYAGYSNFRTNDGCDYYARTYRNNISYLDGAATSFLELTGLVQDHNTWNIGTGVTVTTEDFISLDTAQLYAPRQADGSLPSVNFMHLAEGSDLIDAGIDVGLPYNGLEPDISWVEYGTVLSSKTVKYRGKIVKR